MRANERSLRTSALLRGALTSPAGWQRLEQSAAVPPYPTLRHAAQALGTTQPDLTAQIARLESDLGQTRGRPMKPTQFGKRVADAVNRSRK
ncbi:LysR family transcriptional regulator [Streptomyces sp. NBC_01471]|uniref:LysR family transcriptional regulator n=1 Tax=Streptomyces sp. NBC_01471 TaxID=2903879 RepID=UPI00352F2799